MAGFGSKKWRPQLSAQTETSKTRRRLALERWGASGTFGYGQGLKYKIKSLLALPQILECQGGGRKLG